LLRTASTNVPILSHIGNGLMFFGLIIAFHNPMKPADLFRLLLLSAIWGASFLFIRIGAPVLGPLPTAFFRVLIGAVTLAACLPMLGLKWDMQGKWRAVIILGIINSGIPFVMYAIAALWLPAGYSAIFNAMTPLMGVLIGSLFFAEKLTRAKAAGVLMGLAGVGVLTRTGPVVFSHEVLLGAGLPGGNVMLRTGGLPDAPVDHCSWRSGQSPGRCRQPGGRNVVPAAFQRGRAVAKNTLPAAGPGVWAAMLAVGMFCTAIAYVLYFRLIADLGPVRSLTVTFPDPAVRHRLGLDVPWGIAVVGSRRRDGADWRGGLAGVATGRAGGGAGAGPVVIVTLDQRR
jgi:drug/metabolite transporter (DMT)-like permease